MNYEDEIEQLNEERKKAATRINELMKMRDVKNNLTTCKDEGHVWSLTSVTSDMWEAKKISIGCTRCHAEFTIDFTSINAELASINCKLRQLNWESHETEMLKDLVEQGE